MTEQDWLVCRDWRDMFTPLEGKTGDRKWRLFAVACWRLVWKHLPDEGKKAVEISERYADGNASIQELKAARKIFLAEPGEQDVEMIGGQRYRRAFGGSSADVDALYAAKAAMRDSADAVTMEAMKVCGQSVTAATVSSLLDAEMAIRRRLLHDVVGPQIFQSVTCKPA